MKGKEKVQEYKMKKRLEAFERIIERAKFFAGATENKTFQELKEEMGGKY